MVLNDPALEVRINAARALGQIGRPEAEPAVLQVMKGTNQPPVRYELVRALGSFHTPSSGEQLVWELNNSSNYVRVAALESMGRRAEAKFVPAASRFVNNPDLTVAARAIWALGEVGDPKAIPILVDRLKRSNLPELRRESALALARIGDPASAPALAESALSKNEHPMVRTAAVKALSRVYAGQKVWSELLPLAKDPEPEVRAAAAFTIAKSPTNEVVDSMELLIYDANPFVRLSAVHAMGLQSTRFAMQLSSVGANKAMPLEIRIPALTALGDVSSEDLAKKPIFAQLVKLLDKSDAEATQIAAIKLVSLVGDAAAQGELQRFSNEKDLSHSVREALSSVKK
jgi:HEAT repeat protein